MKTFNIIPALLIVVLPLFTACKTAEVKPVDEKEALTKQMKEFFAKDDKSGSVFKVFLTSDMYEVKQVSYEGVIEKGADEGGDKYIMDEIKRLDMINESRESIISVWLYPDSGRVMKIRPNRATYLLEVDKLLQEDIQRWNFVFPKKYVSPTKFEIHYKVVLRKKQSDDEVMKEIRERMKDSQ
jgi:hypothetical protein